MAASLGVSRFVGLICSANVQFMPHLIHTQNCSDGCHDTGILIPSQQRVLTTLRLRLFHIRPSLQELLVAQNSGELAGDGLIYLLHDLEVGWEEDVEVALVNLLQLAHCIAMGW